MVSNQEICGKAGHFKYTREQTRYLCGKKMNNCAARKSRSRVSNQKHHSGKERGQLRDCREFSVARNYSTGLEMDRNKCKKWPANPDLQGLQYRCRDLEDQTTGLPREVLVSPELLTLTSSESSTRNTGT